MTTAEDGKHLRTCPPTFIDELSGNGALNGIPVTIIDDRGRSRPAASHSSK